MEVVLLTKHTSGFWWSVVSNPVATVVSQAMVTVLANAANEYCEFQNSGCVYRMVRTRDLHKYGIDINDIAPDSILST